jgi:hypothetical protein
LILRYFNKAGDYIIKEYITKKITSTLYFPVLNWGNLRKVLE